MCVEEAGWPAHPLTRGAVIVTLAGQDYLADYFRWSCTSIEASADRFDMLVFHESNARLLDVKCASNVKYIDLGKDGLSRLFVDAVLGSPTRGAVLSEQRQAILSLVEEVRRLSVVCRPSCLMPLPTSTLPAHQHQYCLPLPCSLTASLHR